MNFAGARDQSRDLSHAPRVKFIYHYATGVLKCTVWRLEILEIDPGSMHHSLVLRLEAGLSGTYTANTHPLGLVRFDVESLLIGLI